MSAGEVVLRDTAASAVLHGLLLDAVRSFASDFQGLNFPEDGRKFRAAYANLLPSFEARRLMSPNRGAIAQQILLAMRANVLWQSAGEPVSLHESLSQAAPALPLNMKDFGEAPGWTPTITYRGERWQGSDLADLGDRLLERHVISRAARDALAAMGQRFTDTGPFDLSGRKIVVFGGGAEMAPTRFWLQAGADVLWLDRVPPPDEWLDAEDLGGRLWWAAENCDLLTQPQGVLASIREFADGHPVDLGLYAYAPGQAREVRLTETMNALVNALPAELVRSVTMLVSPTTPTALSDVDEEAIATRRRERAWWEGMLSAVGLLRLNVPSEPPVTPTVVSIQGASYQMAQYVGKILAAEHWASVGQLGGASASPLRLSANTAAITRTRSLAHPVFTAAFGGAAAFGVETMTPRQSRRLGGLLALNDWFSDALPTPGHVRVHGAIHTLPYNLESALRIAAGIGFVRSPRLLRGLFAGNG